MLSKASRALCTFICVSVFTVPPSFSMNLTSKHSCVCLDFVRPFMHFFHVLQMMQMVYFLSGLQQWGQDMAPGRVLNFASLHMYALWNGRLARPWGNHRALTFFLTFPRSGCCWREMPPAAVTSFFLVQMLPVLRQAAPFVHTQTASPGWHYCFQEAHRLAASLETLLQPVVKTAMLSYNTLSGVSSFNIIPPLHHLHGGGN